MGRRLFGRMRSVVFGLIIGMTALAGPAWAAAEMSVDGVWGMSPKGLPVAFVYMTLSLRGASDDRLLSASTPIAASVDLLTPQKVKGRDALMPAAAIEINSHAPSVLQPQGPHLILRGVKHHLEPGSKFVVTLRFEHAGIHQATVTVLKHPPGEGLPRLPKGLKFN